MKGGSVTSFPFRPRQRTIPSPEARLLSKKHLTRQSLVRRSFLPWKTLKIKEKVNLTIRSTLPSSIRSATARKGSNILEKLDRKEKREKVNFFAVFSPKWGKPMAELHLLRRRKLFLSANRTEVYETNYNLSPTFSLKIQKTDNKTPKTPYSRWELP